MTKRLGSTVHPSFHRDVNVQHVYNSLRNPRVTQAVQCLLQPRRCGCGSSSLTPKWMGLQLPTKQ